MSPPFAPDHSKSAPKSYWNLSWCCCRFRLNHLGDEGLFLLVRPDLTMLLQNEPRETSVEQSFQLMTAFDITSAGKPRSRDITWGLFGSLSVIYSQGCLKSMESSIFLGWIPIKPPFSPRDIRGTPAWLPTGFPTWSAGAAEACGLEGELCIIIYNYLSICIYIYMYVCMNCIVLCCVVLYCIVLYCIVM